MKIKCHTDRDEFWELDTPAVPRVGEIVYFGHLKAKVLGVWHYSRLVEGYRYEVDDIQCRVKRLNRKWD
jgi:hypothetical protein